jgi:cell division protein ZipA
LATELRWILGACSVLLLAGIWWWGARRSRQAPGNPQLRESVASPAASAPDAGESRVYDATSRDWGVPPLEPLSIRTADFDQVQIVDMPMTAHPDPLEETLELGTAEREEAASKFALVPTDEAVYAAPEELAADPGSAGQAESFEPVEPAAPETGTAPPAPPPQSTAAAPMSAPATEPSDLAASTGSNQVPNVSETQRIVTLRVCALGDARWSGVDLMTALENHGLAFGRYHVFHRKHSDGRTLFCAASLIEPGTFNLARMPEEEYRGLTLFAVLPGPVEPLQTLDALIVTAGELAATLHGTIQDSKGITLTQQRAEAIRDDVARFQAMLTMA